MGHQWKEDSCGRGVAMMQEQTRDCGSTGKLVCSFHRGCLHLGSFVRADLSSPSPSSAPCHGNPALVQTACSRYYQWDVRAALIFMVSWNMQYVFCVGGLTKITSELVYGAVVMLPENGLVWHSLWVTFRLNGLGEGKHEVGDSWGSFGLARRNLTFFGVSGDGGRMRRRLSQRKCNSHSDIFNCFRTMCCAELSMWQQSSVNKIWL